MNTPFPATGLAFETFPTQLAGCLVLSMPVLADPRGRFVKTFQRSAFDAAGLHSCFVEDYITHSNKDVIRGLHFQTPPHAHFKLVHCLHGQVQDVLLDLRQGSPTYGRHETIRLQAGDGRVVYLPPGIAHGFCVLTDQAILAYKVSSEYNPQHDAGVRWDSAGIQWDCSTPLISVRDQRFPALADFVSPFAGHP